MAAIRLGLIESWTAFEPVGGHHRLGRRLRCVGRSKGGSRSNSSKVEQRLEGVEAVEGEGGVGEGGGGIGRREERTVERAVGDAGEE